MPQIDLIFDSFASHLSLLKENNLLEIEGEYICPICLTSYTKEKIKVLSLEDAPQSSLGGSKIAITCKKCNNTCGHTIDNHLVNFIKYIEEKSFQPGSDRRVKIYHEDNIINGKLEVRGKNDLKMIIPDKINNPNKLSNYISQMTEGVIIGVENNPLKIDMKRVSVAILKNAYIILFSKFGYTFILDEFYNRIRKQILNPMRYIVPNLWTKQSFILLKDGIYFSNNNQYKGFFIIYTLKLLTEHQFCVCIPTPQVYYEFIVNYFETYIPGTALCLISANNTDYLSNIENIKKLKSWLNSWIIYSSTIYK